VQIHPVVDHTCESVKDKLSFKLFDPPNSMLHIVIFLGLATDKISVATAALLDDQKLE